jgi:hypothetical protein
MTEPVRDGAVLTAQRPARDWEALPGGAARPDERHSQYHAVECSQCGAIVRAAKFSLQHTSVQWDAAAVLRCAEFARRAAGGEPTALIERCDSMRDSIDAAVRAGRLPVAPP